jgi:RNA polymerase sigma factor (sigma-70 family)
VTGVTLAVARRSYDMDRDSELELVQRVRAGDTDAFDAVHALFNARLFGFLARLAGNRDVAQDLLEETWLRFVAHADRFEPDSRLGPWLFAVARNLHVSYCRSRAVEMSHAEAGIGLWPAIAPASPFEHAAGHEFERRLEAVIAGLPVGFRDAIMQAAWLVDLSPSKPLGVRGNAAAFTDDGPSRHRRRLLPAVSAET